MNSDLKEQKKYNILLQPFSMKCVYMFILSSNKNDVAYTISCIIKSINISIQDKNVDLGNGGRRGSL